MSHAKKYFINPNSNNVTIPKEGGGSVTVVPFAIRERAQANGEQWYVEGDYYEQYVKVGRSLAPLDSATARKYIKEAEKSEAASHDPSPATASIPKGAAINKKGSTIDRVRAVLRKHGLSELGDNSATLHALVTAVASDTHFVPDSLAEHRQTVAQAIADLSSQELFELRGELATLSTSAGGIPDLGVQVNPQSTIAGAPSTDAKGSPPADDTPAGMGAPHPSAESDASMLHRTVIANEHNRRVADGQNPPGADADAEKNDDSDDDADEIIEDDDAEVEKPAKPMTAMEKLKAKTMGARGRAKDRAAKHKDGK